jgi:hypothetical protein
MGTRSATSQKQLPMPPTAVYPAVPSENGERRMNRCLASNGDPRHEFRGAIDFDYHLLPAHVTVRLRRTAEKVTRLGKKTLAEIVQIGRAFRYARSKLARRFRPWLKAEIGYSRQSAYRYMTVAAWLKGKCNNLLHLPLAPSAALKLAAPGAPEEARQEALERALAGERITHSLALRIIEDQRKKLGLETSSDAIRLFARLERVMDQCQLRWDSPALRVYTNQLLDHLRPLAEADHDVRKGARDG